MTSSLSAFLKCAFFFFGVSGVAAANEAADKDLWAACEYGSLADVERAIRAGADVNAKNEDGVTPLIEAIYNSGHPEIVPALVKAGANVNAVGDNGATALMMALTRSYDNDATVLFLIDAKTDVNVKDAGGETALMIAVQGQASPKIVSSLLRRKADPNAIEDEYGESVLTMALQASDDAALVGMLIKAGAKVNARNGRGHWPIMIAVRHANHRVLPEILTLMAAAGVNFKVADEDGYTPLTRLLYQDGRDPELVAALIDAGADVNWTGPESTLTPLMAAAKNQSSETIRLLLKAGARVNDVTNLGTTALIYATDNYAHGVPLTEILLKAGADANARTRDGDTPLLYAIRKNWVINQDSLLRLAEILIKAGTDVNASNERGETALSLAKEHDLAALAVLLAKAGGE